MNAFTELTGLTGEDLTRLNDMLRWLYGKVQGGIGANDLDAALAAQIAAVDGFRLTDGSVTADKIGGSAVSGWHIAEASIGSAHVGEIEAGRIRGGTLALGGAAGESTVDGAIALKDASGEQTGRIDSSGIRLRDDEGCAAAFQVYRGSGGTLSSGTLTHVAMAFTAASGGQSGLYGTGSLRLAYESAGESRSVEASAGPGQAWLKVDGREAWHAGVVKTGWGWALGNDSAAVPLTKAVAFDPAFDGVPLILAACIGAKAAAGGAPAEPSFPTSGNVAASAYNASAGGFTVRLMPVLGYTLSSAYYYGYSWIAVGPRAR